MPEYTPNQSLPYPVGTDIIRGDATDNLRTDIRNLALAASVELDVADAKNAEQDGRLDGHDADIANHESRIMDNRRDIDNHETRVNALEVMGGVAPGDVSDATVTSLMAQSDSDTRAETDKHFVGRGELVNSIKDFGGVGDGVADDSNAVELALNSGLPISASPGDRYRFTRVITVTDKGTEVSNLEFLADGAQAGIVLDHTTPKVTRWEAVKFYTNRQEPGTALKIQLASGGVVAGRRDAFYYLEDLFFGGVDQLNHGWTVGLHLHNVNMVVMEDIRVMGRRDLSFPAGSAEQSWQAGTKGVYVTADEGADPTAISLKHPKLRHVETGLHIDGDMEGIDISGGHIVACLDGAIVDLTKDSDLSSTQPGLWFRDVHTNTSRLGISITRVTEVACTGCEFYRYAAAHGYNYDAIIGSKVSYSSFTDNKIMLWEQLRDTSETGLRSSPGMFTDLRNSKITGNIIWRGSAGFEYVGAGSVLNRIGDNDFFDEGGKATGYAPYVFSSGAVAGDNIVYATDGGALFSSATGIVASSTSTVVTTLSGLFVAPGERYRYTFEFHGTKGATAGNTSFTVAKNAGTAAIGMSGNSATRYPSTPANALLSGSRVGYFDVSTGGTLSLALSCISPGSDFTTDGVLRVERVA